MSSKCCLSVAHDDGYNSSVLSASPDVEHSTRTTEALKRCGRLGGMRLGLKCIQFVIGRMQKGVFTERKRATIPAGKQILYYEDRQKLT